MKEEGRRKSGRKEAGGMEAREGRESRVEKGKEEQEGRRWGEGYDCSQVRAKAGFHHHNLLNINRFQKYVHKK